jgi:subtilase family serine protease
MLAPTGAMARPAAADTPSWVALPNPNPNSTLPRGTPTPLDPQQAISLRVYLTGQDPDGQMATALDVSDPRDPAYTHYLSPAQYKSQYGPTAAQVSAVSAWFSSNGMAITAANEHYIAVNATVAQADAALDTQITEYDSTVVINGHPYSSSSVGAAGGFSIPTALSTDVATVTGLDQIVPAADPANAPTTHTPRPLTTSAPLTAAASSSYQCSQYWGQHTETIPPAFGHTSAPTQLCGYTVTQMREAYGIASSPYTGKGSTIAIVLNGYSPTMLSDANTFFAGQKVAGFAPGQYSEILDQSAVAASCDDYADQPEETLDVETARIAAPDAKVVYLGTNCSDTDGGQQQNLLDAMTKVVDRHLADVVTDSYSIDESSFSPADTDAWDMTLRQGAAEGIGFNFDSGDGGDGSDPAVGQPANVTFPAADPWATAVGGTSLQIGPGGNPAAQYGWGDNATEVNAAGTGYTSPPPGMFLEGSTGGLSAFFTEPAYQDPVVPEATATNNGAEPPRRTVPDIAADAGSPWLIGYTGAVDDGVYGEIPEGGTSGASPVIAGLEADAKQAGGHAVGFANPALYLLAADSTAIQNVPPVDPADPPMVIGAQPYFGSDTDYLTTLGEDSPSLQSGTGYDEVTGLGAPTRSFVTAFNRL